MAFASPVSQASSCISPFYPKPCLIIHPQTRKRLLCFSSMASQNGSSKNQPNKKAIHVVMPLLAAAFVGCMQPAQGLEWPDLALKPVVADVELQSPSTDDAYQKLLQKIKEKKAQRLGGQRATESPLTTSIGGQRATESTSTTSNVSKETLQKDEKVKEAPRNLRTPSVPKTQVVSSGKQKTHGYMPLFLAQLLMFVGTVGGAVAVFIFPEQVSKKLNDFFDKIQPYVEKAQPIASQAMKTGQELAIQAQPYIQKAWVSSKPLAKKALETSIPLVKNTFEASKPILKDAFEASKPLIKQVQSKATTALQEIQEKAKNLNQ